MRGHEVAAETSTNQCGSARGAVVNKREKLTGKDKGIEAEMSNLEKPFIVHNRVQQSFLISNTEDGLENCCWTTIVHICGQVCKD